MEKKQNVYAVIRSNGNPLIDEIVNVFDEQKDAQEDCDICNACAQSFEGYVFDYYVEVFERTEAKVQNFLAQWNMA